IVSGVRRRVHRTEGHLELAVWRELPHGVVAVVGAVHRVVGTDRDPMRAIGELAFAPRLEELSLVRVDEDRMIAPTAQKDPILELNGNAGHVATFDPGG